MAVSQCAAREERGLPGAGTWAIVRVRLVGGRRTAYPCRVHPTPDAMRFARALARSAVAEEAGDGVEMGAIAGAEVGIAREDALLAITRHRLVPLVAPRAASLGLDSELSAALGELQAAARQRVLAQQLELVSLQAAFDAGGVPCLVFKGLPLAVQTTGSAHGRGAGDIDLLVPPAEVEAAHRVLAGLGWRLRAEDQIAPGSWAWRHVLRNTCALTYEGPGTNVDLHWRLDTTVDALPGFDLLWERREDVVIAGERVPTLSARDALAQSAFHAAKDRWRWLRSLIDIHRLAGQGGLWSGPGALRLRRLEAVALAVTRASVGLPALPAAVEARVGAVSRRSVTRALRDQELPALKGQVTPGVESALNFRYLVTASSSPRDLSRSIAAMTLPVMVVSGIDARSAWTGVPIAWGRRARRLRERTAAWARGAAT